MRRLVVGVVALSVLAGCSSEVEGVAAEQATEEDVGQVETSADSQQVSVVETTAVETTIVEVQTVTTLEPSTVVSIAVEDLAVGDSLNELLGLRKITFVDTTRLAEQGIAELTKLLEFLIANPEIHVNLRVHTQWFAPQVTLDDQVRFSEFQARHAGLYLTNSGVESDRVTTEAVGSAEQIIVPFDTTGVYPDKTEEQKRNLRDALEANNRVEVVVSAL